ncbi:MAG: hypothetical protein LBV46_00615 [Bacteroidales bacterium]|nr:hypothetical protein [Bacteroidales bacterium]
MQKEKSFSANKQTIFMKREWKTYFQDAIPNEKKANFWEDVADKVFADIEKWFKK